MHIGRKSLIKIVGSLKGNSSLDLAKGEMAAGYNVTLYIYIYILCRSGRERKKIEKRKKRFYSKSCDTWIAHRFHFISVSFFIFLFHWKINYFFFFFIKYRPHKLQLRIFIYVCAKRAPGSCAVVAGDKSFDRQHKRRMKIKNKKNKKSQQKNVESVA